MILILHRVSWLDGASLAVCGLAIVLAWCGLSRLVDIAHVYSLERGWITFPLRRFHPPMKHHSELVSSILGVTTAVGVAAGFTVPMIRGLFGDIAMIEAATTAYPWSTLIRVHAALALELYFLHKLSLTPAYKMRWAFWWYFFCLVVGAL